MDKTVKIMGILNVTPDSLFDGGRFFDVKRAIARAYEMKDEGADIIDIGGESTRPGSKPVSASEEIDRVCPVIEAVSRDIGIPLSVDTTKYEVAVRSLELGASIVNDVSGLTFDERLADAAARYGAGLVISHIQGTPETMQANPSYSDLMGEICDFLNAAADRALNRGVSRERVIVDPGIGFGKTLEQNYVIIDQMNRLKSLGYPVLIGLSRKSLIGRLYPEGTDRLPATIALNAVAVRNGADIIRVHDVKAHRLALDSLEMLRKVS